MQRTQYLLHVYLHDMATLEELAELEVSFRNPALAAEIELLLAEEYVNFRAEDYPALNQRSGERLYQSIISASPQRTYRKHRVAFAAASLFFILLGSVLTYMAYRGSGDRIEDRQVSYRGDIRPGRVGATLKLANGQIVRLSEVAEGELPGDPDVVISKSASGQLIYKFKEGVRPSGGAFNTLSTGRGETYQICMADGSIINLNASSRLTFSTGLMENGVRSVRLEGEGYFQIAKDPQHPFIVESGGQQVEVLGTKFNIAAYPEQKGMQTTLLEGSVKIRSHGLERRIRPGQQAESSSSGIQIRNVDAAGVTAWKNDAFLFEDVNLPTIMKALERWYDVRVVYETNVSGMAFWLSAPRYDNVSEILKDLESTQEVRFRIEGRTIYVMDK